MADDLNTEIKIGADASGVEAGVGKAKRSLASLGETAKKAGQDAGAGMASVGAGGDKAAKDVERATKNIQGQLQRAIASFEAGEKGSRKFYESIARQRGVDVSTIKPLLDQLDAYKSKSEAAAQASAKVGTSFTGLSTAAGLAARAMAAIGISASVGEFVRMADASTNVASRLGLVTSSAAELANVQQRLFGIAQSSRVSFTDLVGTYAQVARSTKDLGVSQTALLGVIQTISQAVTISGGSAASAQAALVQLSQGFAAGALRGEELNSIMEQTPRLAQAIADGMGVSVGKLRELGQAGALTAEAVLGALEKSAAGVAAEFGKMAVTVEQASTNAANSVLRLVGAFDRLLGVTSAISGAIQTISNAVDFLSSDVEKLGNQGPLRDAAREVINLNAAAERLRTGMASGVLGPNAQVELDRINARLAEAKQRFRELDQQLSGVRDPRDQSGFTGRGASYANEAARIAKLREDANAFRLNQAGVPASYLKDMAELIRLNQAGVIVGKEYTDALKKQQDELLKKTGAVKSSNAAANQEQNAYESLIASIRAKIEADKLEMAGGAALTESQRIRIKLDQDLAAGRVKLTAQNERAVRLALEELAASEASALAAKTLAKANLDAAASREKYLTSLSTGLDKIKADTAAQLEATARMGLSKEAIAELDAAKLEMLATDLELQAIKAMDRNLDEQTYSALKQQAEAYRELAAAKKAGATKEMALDLEKANREAAKKAADEWERAADDINRSLTDALMRGFESGKDFAKNMRDTVVNMFKTMVLRPVISAVMSPVAGAINGMLYGNAAAAVGGGASALGMLGSGANLINGLQGTQGMLGTVGGWLGMNTVAANTALASTIGIDAASAAAAANAAGAAGGGLLSGFGAALPWIGGIAALASILGGLDDSGTYHTGGAAQYSGADGLRTSLGPEDKDQFGIGMGWFRRGDQTISAVSAIASVVGGALDTLATSFGKKAGYEVATAFADDSSGDGAWGALRISMDGQDVLNWRNTQTSRWAPKEFANGEEGYKQYLAAVAKDTRQVLLDMDLPGWADTVLTAIGDSPSIDSLSAALTQIGQAQAVFKSFGQYMTTFATLADSSVTKLAAASGGIGALAGNMGVFVDQFYTDAEKLAVNTENLSEAMGKLGFELPTTRDEFKALVQAQLALGDAGAETAAGLLAVSGAFASVTQAAEAAAQAAEQAAQAERERASTLRGSFGALADSLADMRSGVADADARVAASRMAIWQGYNDAQQKVIDLEMQAAEATRSFAQSLRSFIGDMATGPQSSMGLESRYRTMQQQLEQTAAQAGAGDQGARDRLPGVASSYLDASRARSSTSVDYARDAARVRVTLGNLASTAEADPLVQKYDAESLTIQQQIADAQIDVVKYLALMEATGVSTDLGIQTVDKTLSELRDEYIAAEQAQAAANLKLDVALAALDALGLTESLVNAIAANQTNSLSGALNISDEALASITGALGLTPENVAEIGQQFGVEVALLVGQAATDLAATLQSALAFDPAVFDALRTVVGYDSASPDFTALQTILGFDLESDKFRALGTILGLAPGASAQVDALLGGIGFTGDAAAHAETLAQGVSFTSAAVGNIEALTAGVDFAPDARLIIEQIAAGIAWTNESAALTSGLNAGVGWSGDVGAQVQGLLSGLALSADASAQVDGLLDGLKLSAADRVTIERMLGGIRFDTATATALHNGLGLQSGLLPMLGSALGLSAEAAKAIGVLSGMGSIDQAVRNAYAMVGRSGIGTGVNQIDQEGYDYWTKSLATGAVSMGEFQQRFLQVAAEAPDADLRAYIAPYMKKLGIPGFAVGTNYVTDDMLAVVHKGEAIVPKAYNPAAGGGGNNNAELVAELRAMRAELAELRAIKSELAAINRSSSTTATGMTGIVNKQVSIVTEAA